MTKQKLIVNLGLARCGTTATEDFFRTLPEFSTPKHVKELKFFLRSQESGDYIKNFKVNTSSILFESSPPYMHGGLEMFYDVVERIKSFEDQGYYPYLLINIRNLLKRAFSHYWHDINGHYSIYGRYWKVSTPDDPLRYGKLYEKGFISEISSSESKVKFLPEVGLMLEHAIATFGANRVRILITPELDRGITEYLKEILPSTDFPVVRTRRIPGTRAPVYLYGGEHGATFKTKSDSGEKSVIIPPHKCILLARRHQEVISGVDYDLKRIVAASQNWSESCSKTELPKAFFNYLDIQYNIIANIPNSCFLGVTKERALDEIFSIPNKITIRKNEPETTVIENLLANTHSSEAERDGKVMVGRSGRLFLHHDMNKVIAQHSGELLLSDSDLKAWKSTLENRTIRCSDMGIEYHMIFAPDTHAVYREDIPILPKIVSSRPVKQILEAYTDVNLHYPLSELKEAKKYGEVCHVTDSHWSSFGAFVAYEALVSKFRLSCPTFEKTEYVLQEKNLVGDLGLKFDPPRSGRTTDVLIPKHSSKIWNNGVSNRGHMSLWVGKKRHLPRALLLTDSYGWKFQVFLAQSFSDLLVVHSPIFETEAVERFCPDIVVSLLAERFAYKVPNDAEDLTAIQHAVQKIPGSEYPDFEKLILSYV